MGAVIAPGCLEHDSALARDGTVRLRRRPVAGRAKAVAQLVGSWHLRCLHDVLSRHSRSAVIVPYLFRHPGAAQHGDTTLRRRLARRNERVRRWRHRAVGGGGCIFKRSLARFVEGRPPGQAEAARSLGLRPGQVFSLVVLPQLVRVALPGLGNIWTALVKDTSLISTLAVSDLLRAASEASRATTRPILFYSAAAAIYLAFSILSGIGQAYLERRTNQGYS